MNLNQNRNRWTVASVAYIGGVALVAALYIGYHTKRAADAMSRMEARQLERERRAMKDLEDDIDGGRR